MHLTGFEHLLTDVAAVAVLVLLLGVIVLVAAATMVVRRSRRRWRTLRRRLLLRHPARPGVPTLLAGVDGRALAASGVRAAATTVGSPRWWATQQARRCMWRDVTAARHAVSVARRAGAPVGDLPALARQLETAARSADALARAGARSPRSAAPATAEVRRIDEAAQQIRRAAVDSLQTVATAETDLLLPSVRLEVAALAAGMRAVGALRGPAA